MMDSAENVISMMVPIITENFKSLKTLNLLARSSKSLSTSIYGDKALIRDITKRMPLMTRIEIRKLFLLAPNTFVPFAAIQEQPSPYPWSRTFLKCSAFDAFALSMDVHESIPALARAFDRRQVRSNAMKLVWVAKTRRVVDACRQRSEELVQIRADLAMVHQRDHYRTWSEITYSIEGTLRRLNGVYRDKMLMKIHNKPSPTNEDTKTVELYKREKHNPGSLSHTEKLCILSANVAYEHWLSNFTSHRELSISVTRLTGIVHPIDFLFPLPDIWPWVDGTPTFNIGGFKYNEIPELYIKWRTEHDVFYEDEPEKLD
jgi:hypothetical protein